MTIVVLVIMHLNAEMVICESLDLTCHLLRMDRTTIGPPEHIIQRAQLPDQNGLEPDTITVDQRVMLSAPIRTGFGEDPVLINPQSTSHGSPRHMTGQDKIIVFSRGFIEEGTSSQNHSGVIGEFPGHCPLCIELEVI